MRSCCLVSVQSIDVLHLDLQAVPRGVREHRAILVYRSSLSSRWHGPVAPEGLAGWGFLGRTRSRSGGAVCGLSIRYVGGSAGYVVRWSPSNNGLYGFCPSRLSSRLH